MATTIEQERAGTFVERARIGWGIGVLAALALAAVAVAAVVFMTQAPSAQVNESPVRSIYTQDELEVFRLVDAGVLPSSVLDAEPFRTKRLVARGVDPPRDARDGRSDRGNARLPGGAGRDEGGRQPASSRPRSWTASRSSPGGSSLKALIPWQAAPPCAW